MKGGKKRARVANGKAAEGEGGKNHQSEEDKEGGKKKEENKGGKETDAEDVVDGESDGIVEGSEEEVTESKTDPSAARTMFVSNLPPNCTRRDLLRKFKASSHPVESARIRGAPSVSDRGVKLPEGQKGNSKMERKVLANSKDWEGNEGRVGYVVFESVEGLQEAKGKEWRMGERLLYVVGVEEDVTDSAEHSVFVGNIPFGVDEETLRRHAEDRAGGKCLRARIVRDKESRVSKGCGYLLFESKVVVGGVLKNGLGSLKKKELRVEVCGKRTKGKGKKKERKQDVRGRENAREGAGRRVLGKMKRKGRVGGNEKSVPKRKAQSAVKVQGGNKGGGGKRAGREKKVKSRVKKLEKRVKTGMGAQKKGK